MQSYFVNIMSSISGTLYIGVTSDLERRVSEHKRGVIKGFTSRYNVTKLVYVESYSRIDDAILREKQIKRWFRAKKIALINADNPT